MTESALTVIDQKLSRLTVILILFFAIIASRLFYLQICRNGEFALLGQKNFTRTFAIISPRGNITDCSGHLLATNRPVKNLIWLGSNQHHLTNDQLKAIQRITKITSRTLDLTAIKAAERYGKQLLLGTDLPFNQLSQILESCAACTNLTVTTDFARYYPYGDLAAHVMGYLGSMNLEKMGRMGLEKIFESQLRGQNGQSETMINSTGKQISQRKIAQTIAGQTIHTTINIHLQKMAEAVFPAAYRGSIIIMEPKSGAIRTLISRPTFDPGLFLEPMSQQTWQELQASRPFVNRALNAAYPPASIFKLVTIAAALELNLINPTTELNCLGHITFGQRRYHCNNIYGHGYLTVKQALAQSCNIPFYELGKQLTIDKLAHYANAFGLGQPTGILFPEHSGLVPTKAWKLSTKGEPWWIGETLSAAIGQSFLLVTPTQIARMISAIFTGHLITPRILENEAINIQPVAIKDSTRQFLQESMHLVVTSGTGQKLGRWPGLLIFAKTGTAQTCALTSQKKTDNLRDHVWFASYLQFENHCPLVLVILIENAGTTRVAVRTAKKFLQKYCATISDLNEDRQLLA